MRSGEIRALSGLRIVAALWVVLFHFRPLLEMASPPLYDSLKPILDCGAQGVDLFFILSGFVLTWNYLDRMGDSWSTRSTMHFLWLRLARVWPLYLFTMHLAALWIVFTLNVGDFPSPEASTLTAVTYLRQLFMVQLWFQPFFDGSSWDGPAWSISAEWLAYLLFGLLVLAVFRIQRATRARGLLLLAVAVSLPPMLLLVGSGGQFYTPWSWLPRIVLQFTAGALACAAVRKLRPTERAQRGAGLASVLLLATIVGALYWFQAHPIPSIRDDFGLVGVLFMPLIVTLAIGSGTLPALLSTRALVYGGQVSFGLYMVHELVHTSWLWIMAQYEITMVPSINAKLVFVGLIVVAVVLAILLFHFVEEPARMWMRRMVGERRTPVEVAHTPLSDPAGDVLKSIAGPGEDRPKTLRAG
ncbi:acyltransferase [Mycobacterium antarcticum]|uniref:acyltransferase family protein n=1 Tax=unclassified Mycolicibacterium TaxID=2636767 RepID=UPI0023A2BE6E|nr:MULTISPECIES: acyltransferase [unclassified Mycolicibacterium]BDX31991.1 acyltransferase [Mycolicibacterium sp. TUM20985]GLP84441.1 acyltransferase [Mycolicibacterium sp. TUM20984]